MGYVKLNIENGIGTVEFYDEKSNALPGRTLEKLTETINSAGEREDIKVILLRSAGDRAFCAGASFDELIAVKNEVEGKAFFMGFANVINAMRMCPKFIIGRIQGKAVGGGIGLAAATDYCFATNYSAVKLSELAVGIGPFVVSPAIERKMGISAVQQMALNATEFHEPEWAMQKGLFYEVYNTIEEMDNSIKELAEKLAKANPAAMTELKKTAWAGTNHWDVLLPERAEISGKLVTSEFTRNFIQKFKEKR